MMWPFDDPEKQIGMHQPVPKLGRESNEDDIRLKLKELQVRLTGLEFAVIELAKLLGHHRQVCNANFMQIDKNLATLVDYVMRPRTQIMGDQQDKN